MDTQIYRGFPGLEPDSPETGDGANYLRRLKANSTEAAPVDPAVKGGDPAPAVGFKERRQSPRHRCTGSVEFRAAGREGRMWGTLTDISLHGCYVEMSTTFPVNCKVELELKSFDIQIHAPGTVRASYPFLGMGIAFADLEPEQRQHLRQLLEVLAGQSATNDDQAAEKTGLRDALAGADPRAILDEVADFFQTRQLLSREELRQIVNKLRRA
ncbi:MAG: PilZ domain-containing protein [Terriglobales bacterium]